MGQERIAARPRGRTWLAPAGCLRRGGPLPGVAGEPSLRALPRRLAGRPPAPRRAHDRRARGGSEERLLVQRFGRLRDVVQGPDGWLYVVTSNRDGRGQPRPGDDKLLRLRAP